MLLVPLGVLIYSSKRSNQYESMPSPVPTTIMIYVYLQAFFAIYCFFLRLKQIARNSFISHKVSFGDNL